MKSPPSLTKNNALIQHALALHQSGKLLEASQEYQKALVMLPEHPQLLKGLGTISLQLGNIEEGVRLIRKALEIIPDQPSLHFNLAAALHLLNRFDEALASYDRAIALQPDFAEAHYRKGISLHELNRFDEALASYDRAIILKPGYAPAYNSRGIALHRLNRLDEALASYDRAITLQSNYAVAYNNRGVTLFELKRFEEAASNHAHAITLKPDYADAYNNRGMALNALNQFDEALANYDQAIALQPSNADLHYKRGNTLQYLSRFDQALTSYDHAIALQPDFADAYWNKSLLKLLLGEYIEGWRLYEWRWKAEYGSSAKYSIRKFNQPIWLGEKPINGKILLIYSEQGLGDAIQFCRYACMVETLGAKVVLEVPKSLVKLIGSLQGDYVVIGKGEPLPPFDYQCPIMSLPLSFKTSLATIPNSIPYLYANPEKKVIWNKLLGLKNKPRVGLAWSGSIAHDNDHNRSILLKKFETLLQLSLDFHSLQKEIRPEDAITLSNLPQIKTYQDKLNDFSDTAALLDEMDVVISVDTSVAHLAGALGKKILILLPFLPDYRWMLDRQDSPWYPTATLIRQPTNGDWESVINEVIDRLKEICS